MSRMIVYIGSFSFPLGDAVAKRVLGIGISLSKVGYKVAYIGEDKSVAPGEISAEKDYESFKYCCIHKSLTALEHYEYRADLKLLEQKLKEWNIADNILAVILCGTKCSFFASGIIKICKKMDIPTIADSMDWLKTHTGNWLFDCIKQADITNELCRVNKKTNGVIAISSYLSNYYNKHGMKTVIIPPLSPYNEESVTVQPNEKLTLVYAGIPCRLGQPLKNPADAKDRLDLAMYLLKKADEESCEFKLIVYGLTAEQYSIVFPDQKEIIKELIRTEHVCFMGYSEEAVVREAIRKADYTILLRDKNRTSMAGFPTKISESISLGTPVITTETSNITAYVKDGVDGFYLNLSDFNKATEELIRILRAGRDKSAELKKHIKENNSFRPETYADVLGKFIETVTQ